MGWVRASGNHSCLLSSRLTGFAMAAGPEWTSRHEQAFSLQHIGRPHSGIGQSPAHTPVPGHTEGLWGSLSASSGLLSVAGGAGRGRSGRARGACLLERKGSLKTTSGGGLNWAWVDHRWPWIVVTRIPPWAASLAGEVLRGVGTSAYPPPWSWRRLNIVSSLWPLNQYQWELRR